MGESFSIGAAARASGVHVETIRYYERRGILPRPQRSAAGQRRYDMQDVARLRLIRRCRDLGFGLAEASALLRLAEGQAAAGAVDCDSVRALAERHREAVRARLAELRALEATLDGMIAECAADSDACAIARRLLAPPDAVASGSSPAQR